MIRIWKADEWPPHWPDDPTKKQKKQYPIVLREHWDWFVEHEGELDNFDGYSGWIGELHPVSVMKMGERRFAVTEHNCGCQCCNDE